MSKLFLDTNLIVRYLLGDIESQKNLVVDLIDQASTKKNNLIILPEVLIELNYVLRHHYNLSKELIGLSMGTILKISVIQVWGVEDFEQALNIYQKHNISLEDAYFISCCLQNKLKFISFDKKALGVWEKLQ